METTKQNYDEAKRTSIKDDYIVNKANPLMLVRDNMKILQARFFNAYLSKVNPLDEKTYTVEFSIKSFCKLLDVASDITKIREAADGVLNTQFDFQNYIQKKQDGEVDKMLMKKVNLFERISIDGNSTDGYYVEIVPTRPMEHLLRNQAKYGYVKYQLQNTLCLSTVRNMRMYELLARYTSKGLQISIPLLKDYLGIEQGKYSDIRIFNRDVVKKTILEINKKTDIYVEVENIKNGRNITGFLFIIKEQTPKPTSQYTELDDDACIIEYSNVEMTKFNKKTKPILDISLE